MKAYRIVFVVLCVTTMLCLCGLSGCSGKADILQQCTGVWQAQKGQETVEVRLVGDSKQIIVNGQPFPATVQSIDAGKYLTVLKVQQSDGSAAEWTLQQRWDDNGSRFDLVFSRDGHQQVLSAKS